jgi:hypothetical protein
VGKNTLNPAAVALSLPFLFVIPEWDLPLQLRVLLFVIPQGSASAFAVAFLLLLLAPLIHNKSVILSAATRALRVAKSKDLRLHSHCNQAAFNIT